MLTAASKTLASVHKTCAHFVLVIAVMLSLAQVCAAVSDKSLIKLSSGPTVYWLQNNRTYGIVSQSILDTMKNNGMAGWTGSITTVTNLSPYVPGPNFISTDGSSNGLLMKLPSDPTVYEVHFGGKEPLSLDTFNQRGYSFSNVIDVPQAILNMFQTQASLPDLTISADVAFSYTGAQNVQIPVTVYRNGGNLPDGNYVTARLYWSTDPNLDAGDTLLWSSSSVTPDFPVSYLNSNPSKTVTANLTIPSQASGSYFIIGVVDPDSSFSEANENNNLSAASVTIQSLQQQVEGLAYGTDDGHFGTGDSPESNAGFNDDSVNTAVGNFNYRETDLIVHGRGLDFDFSRSYNAKDSRVGPMGRGWSHSFNIFLVDLGTTSYSSVTVHYSDGKLLTFDQQNGSNYLPRLQGFHDFIIANADGTWSLMKTDQREYRFNNIGKLIYIQDRNGNRLTLSYYSDLTLAQVVDTVGRVFNFYYQNSLLTDIYDPIGRHFQYQYSNGQLATYRDANSNFTNYVYDGNARLWQVYDGRGTRILTNTYDSQGRLQSQTNGRNFLWQFSYDDLSHTTYVTDPNQHTAVYSHDARFNLQRSTDRLNRSASIEYDDYNNRRRVSDFNNNYFSYAYDGNGNVSQSRDPLNNARQFYYDGMNNPIQAVDELSHPTSMGYDVRGNLSTVTDAKNNASSITYDGFGQPASVTDFNHNTTFLSYDSQGNLIRMQDAANNVTSFGYDGAGRRTSMTDARGRTTRYFYDNNDNLTAVQRPIGTTTYSYDQADNLIAVTDPANNVTRFEYDANKNQTKETDPLGFYVQDTYDTLDRLVIRRDKKGNNTNYEYDNEGHLLSVTDPLSNKTSFTYDGNGNRLTITDANNQTTRFTYDSLNRIKTIQDPLGNTILRDYDPAGRLIKETDGRGNATFFSYDEVNNLTQVNDPEGGVTRYVYDANHNLSIQIDANQHASVFNYDRLNRLTSSKDPLNNTYSYSYDEVGNRISQTDAKQQTSRFIYDDNNRLVGIAYADSTVVQLDYDVNGNLTQMRDSLGTSRYAYDVLNRLTSYTDVYGNTIGYKYDPNGNIEFLIYPDGKQVRYTYDAANRMISLTDWTGRTLSYEYNNINLLTKIIPPSITDNGQTTYSYDLAGRLTGMVNFHSHGPANSYAFTLDQNGNRTAAVIQEPLPNRIAVSSQGYNYDAANRIQNAGAATFTSDANGNITSKTENGVTTNFTYDSIDRLINDQTNAYLYNGQNVRVAKIHAGVSTRYVVDTNRELSQVLCETDGTGTITSYYIYGQGLVYKVLPNGNHYYYQFDPNGSTISMTSDGDFYLNRYAYDSFGNITNSAEVFPNTGATFPNQFKFGGRFGLIDEGNGLVYVRARYYSPALGRFLTKDPLQGNFRDGQSLNRYIYALNNPVRLIDVNGHYSISAFWSDVKSVSKDFAVGLGEDLLKASTKGAWTAYSKLGYRSLPYDLPELRGGAIGGIKSEIGVKSVSKTAIYAVANLLIDKALNKIEGPRENLTVGGYDLSQGLPFLEDVPYVNVVNLAAGKTLFRYGVVGDNADANGDLWEHGKKVGNLRDHGITGPAPTTNPVKSSIKTPTVAPPKSTAIHPRGPAPKVQPRGPAAAPIMPRGPKPAPIMPRGPAPHIR